MNNFGKIRFLWGVKAVWIQTLANLTELFTRIANEEPLYIKGDRVGGGGRIAQGALDAAHRYFAELTVV